MAYGASRRGGDQALQFDARHSPALHLQNRKAITSKNKTFASARNEAEVREAETAQGRISGIFGELDLVLRLEIAKAYGSINNHSHFQPMTDDLLILYDVELIVNFAYSF